MSFFSKVAFFRNPRCRCPSPPIRAVRQLSRYSGQKRDKQTSFRETVRETSSPHSLRHQALSRIPSCRWYAQVLFQSVFSHRKLYHFMRRKSSKGRMDRFSCASRQRESPQLCSPPTAGKHGDPKNPLHPILNTNRFWMKYPTKKSTASAKIFIAVIATPLTSSSAPKVSVSA